MLMVEKKIRNKWKIKRGEKVKKGELKANIIVKEIKINN